MTIGIIGAGKLGITLAQLALKAGREVMISSSKGASKIRLIVETLAPGAVAASNEEVTCQADVVILALPLGKFRQLKPSDFAGKLVIDAMNYWWEVDGPRSDILPDEQSSSQLVQEYFSDARVVKAFSHMGYHDLHDEPRPRGTPGRKALALAGDDEGDVKKVAQIVDDFGFDPFPIGPLEGGRQLEPGGPVFGANLPTDELRKLLV